MPHKDQSDKRAKARERDRKRAGAVDVVERLLTKQRLRDRDEGVNYPDPLPGGWATVAREKKNRIVTFYWQHEALFRQHMCRKCKRWFYPNPSKSVVCSRCREKKRPLYQKPAHDVPRNPRDVAAERVCLGCGRAFQSGGIGNRLCIVCKGRSA